MPFGRWGWRLGVNHSSSQHLFPADGSASSHDTGKPFHAEGQRLLPSRSGSCHRGSPPPPPPPLRAPSFPMNTVCWRTAIPLSVREWQCQTFVLSPGSGEAGAGASSTGYSVVTVVLWLLRCKSQSSEGCLILSFMDGQPFLRKMTFLLPTQTHTWPGLPGHQAARENPTRF